MSDEMATLNRYFREVLGIQPTAPVKGSPGPPGRKPGRVGKGRAQDEVDRAVSSVGRAIVRLVGLLGRDDPLVVARALLALDDLGGDAVVGPLAAALGKSRSPRLRMVISAYLGTFGDEHKAPVTRALIEAGIRHPLRPDTAATQGALRSRIAELLSRHRASRGPSPGGARGTAPGA